jgi:threonine dehydrogenase-like Zn-dependent dehydrogenase
MCHHVRAADQRNLHLALLQTNEHSTVPGPVIAPSLLPIAAKICRRSVSQRKSVVIYGGGPVGLMAAYSAALKGASRVMVVARHPNRLGLAGRIGPFPSMTPRRPR